MKPERYKLYLNKQIKEIEKAKWDEGIRVGSDPGNGFVQEWVKKYSKRFRKKFALKDLRNAFRELKVIRKSINSYMKKIMKMTRFINKCEERLLEGIELLENEKENGTNSK